MYQLPGSDGLREKASKQSDSLRVQHSSEVTETSKNHGSEALSKNKEKNLTGSARGKMNESGRCRSVGTNEFGSLLMSGSCQGEAESQSGGKHPVSSRAADAPHAACVDGEVG